MQADIVERKLAELNEYASGMFDIFVRWFAFFAGVNYLAIGWLTRPDSKTSDLPTSTQLISCLFICQNILGLVACIFVWKYFKETDLRIQRLEEIAWPDRGTLNKSIICRSSLPADTYMLAASLLGLALVIIAVAWICIGFPGALPLTVQHFLGIGR
ncbi:hypothetical protein PQR71_12130 [Paraburkholderia fungorum]|uniref:hypothetical protein n=1 Tax=Paraburkholderia fungorum TaxID=134537 RepID=UPI0038B8C7FA